MKLIAHLLILLSFTAYGAPTKEQLAQHVSQLKQVSSQLSSLDPAQIKPFVEESQKVLQEAEAANFSDKGLLNDFKRLQSKLLNYLELQRVFSTCIEEKYRDDQSKNLQARVLDAAGQVSYVNVNCAAHLRNVDSLSDHTNTLAKQIGDITSGMRNGALQEGIHDQSLENTARQAVWMLNTYEVKDSEGKIISPTPQNALNMLCQPKKKGFMASILGAEQKERCTSEQKQKLSKVMQQEHRSWQTRAAQNAPGFKRYTNEEVAQSVTSSLQKVNQKIDDMNAKVKPDRWLWGAFRNVAGVNNLLHSVEETEEGQAAYQAYVESYMGEASNGPNRILGTEAMSKAVGVMKDFQRSASDGKVTYQRHKKALATDVASGVEEFRDRLGEQMDRLAKLREKKDKDDSNPAIKNNPKKYSEKREKDLKSLVANDPLAAGYYLINNPQFAAQICDIFNQVYATQEKVAKWNQYAGIGLAVAGVALMATGVGAGVGGWVLGSSAAPLITGIAAVTTYAGLGIGVTEMAYWGNRMHESDKQKQQLLNSYLSGSGDKRNLEDARKALSAYNQAETDFLLSTGFSLVDALGVYKTVKASGVSLKQAWNPIKVVKAENLRSGLTAAGRRHQDISELTGFLDEAKSVSNLVRRNSVARKGLEAVRRKGSSTVLGKVFGGITSFPSRARLRILSGINRRLGVGFNGKQKGLFRVLDEAHAEAIDKAMRSGHISNFEAKGLVQGLGDAGVAKLEFKGERYSGALDRNLANSKGPQVVAQEEPFKKINVPDFVKNEFKKPEYDEIIIGRSPEEIELMQKYATIQHQVYGKKWDDINTDLHRRINSCGR